MKEELFELTGKDGLNRRGVVTYPDHDAGLKTALLLLPAGLKYRVGPHRLYVRLARALADKGYTTVRYDPLGIGESDGCLEKGPIRALWQTVEQGRYLRDTLLAVDYIQNDLGLKQIFAGGLCGGAVSAVLAAYYARQKISGVFSINIAVSQSAPGIQMKPVMGRASADYQFQTYMKKLSSPAAWRRLLSLESDFQSLGRMIFAKVARPFRKQGLVQRADDPRLNHFLITALEELRRRRFPHLLIFSGNDQRWLEFEDMVIDARFHGNFADDNSQVFIVDQANHELQLTLWQDEAIGILDTWLTERLTGKKANVA